ncbi:helix-turn-helix domain-containing protein [Lacrimispora sp.]|uniref:helix-turn-helix domain-containing protein n=1 Tax=Lacrimispora sp. TaxID=2719234 RepID=UPI0028A1DD76|nr:helix-turn-helix transcriptional regulator [Lacrimispora sp.]
MKYERFQDLREEHFWTQKYVAHQLNIAQRTYSHYENGTRSIPLELLCTLADLYEVSTDYLLNRTNIRKPYL